MFHAQPADVVEMMQRRLFISLGTHKRKERFLLYGLGAIISCVMLACIRHRRKEKINSDADWQ